VLIYVHRMSIKLTNICPRCHTDLGHEIDGKTYSNVIGVQYANGPERYDGVSEWRCPVCGYREGRWSGRELGPGEIEPRFGGED
jgi:hypothetical protein